MDFFPASTSANGWSRRADDYVTRQLSMRPIRSLVLKGAVDVVFRRHHEPTLVVAAENPTALDSVRITFKDDKLIIDNEVAAISIGNMRILGQARINGRLVGPKQVLIGVGLASLPKCKAMGNGTVTLLDLNQPGLQLKMTGAVNMEAFGRVDHLVVDLVGAGNIDAAELLARSADLSLSGAGDITASVVDEVVARLSGCGRIEILGDPPRRDQRVTGMGKIKFRGG